MPKKRYFVLNPAKDETELSRKAASYYGNKDYEEITNDPKMWELVKSIVGDPDKEQSKLNANAHMLTIGCSLIAMSMSDSVYICKDWENYDYCKVCHAIAFSHGLEIVYES